MGADVTLADLSASLARHKITPSTEVVLYRPDGAAVAYPDIQQLVVTNGATHLVQVDKLSPALGELFQRGLDKDRQGAMQLAGKRWQVSYSQFDEGGPNGLRLALLAPEEELLADAYRIRWQGAVLTIGILVLCLPLGWLLSRILVKPLRALVHEAEAIRSFNFAHPASGHSPVLEIDQLAVAMGKMKDTLSSFLDITASLSAETRFDALLRRVLKETVDLSEASAGLLYLRDESGALVPHGLFINDEQHSLEEHRIPSYAAGRPQHAAVGPPAGGRRCHRRGLHRLRSGQWLPEPAAYARQPARAPGQYRPAQPAGRHPRRPPAAAPRQRRGGRTRRAAPAADRLCRGGIRRRRPVHRKSAPAGTAEEAAGRLHPADCRRHRRQESPTPAATASGSRI